MKTLLMWGVGSDLSRRAAQKLAADGHRLLLAGESREVLEDLDAQLSQSELHRFASALPPNDFATWTQEQNLGLDGLILFPPSPEPSATLFVPVSFNARNTERSLFAVIELIRALLPQLRRGKRPKRVLVVLDWRNEDEPNVLGQCLEQAWKAALPTITQELNKEGSHFNLLCLLETTGVAQCEPINPESAPGTGAADTEKPLHAKEAPASESAEEPLGSSGPEAPPPSEYVHSTLSLIGLYFSPTMQFLNGQFLQHPSPAVGLRTTPSRH